MVSSVGASEYLCNQSLLVTHHNPTEVDKMTGTTSPSGATHPGQILFEDRVDNRQWTKQADEVPQTIAWVNVEGEWHSVTRIEITGTVEKRRITKYGQNGDFLETTIQSPPPRP
ncbi:hypothetical protein [Anabaena sp. CCY 0017]|uniref:hypothetical protein n=1 Tax=Anabaena sp. CCY 0017 TaxID=3103866 RepID=UPI0039C72EF5